MAQPSKPSEKLNLPSHFFNDMAKRYETGLGGANRDIVRALLQRCKTESAITSDSIIHDNACGPAVVTSLILEEDASPPPQIYATDYAQGMIDIAQSYKTTKGWDSVTVQQMDGQTLAFEDNKFTHSISSLGVFMFPDEKKGLGEMYRTLKPGGWVAITSWKDVRWPTAARAAYAQIFPNAEQAMVLPNAANWEEPENCEKMLKSAGFENVKSEVIECINRQPSKEAGISVQTGFLRTLSPTAKEWDDETWDRYCKSFGEVADDMFVESPDGNGVQTFMYAIVTSGTK
ncbi:hypothetical protein ABW20_dc0101856 [Dactylellina cionopaga]|nr:hypothetical protein ABW20_dc0101856 [Dactylellina cionopaga]